jgi:hydroxymethylpyrimidine/phosphomethylpyrimidine kinase
MPEFPRPSPPDSDDAVESDSSPDDDIGSPPCVLVFNANDPSGAGGLSADISAIASVGGHALAVVTGSYARDTAEVFDHYCMDEEAVAEQARVILEDVPVQVFKVGFVGSPENLGAIAAIASDYADTPLVAYMPNLSWWEENRIEEYLDAFRELLLPQASVLVGNHSTLSRWLLPEWSGERAPSARDIAAAAGRMGVGYTLVTGIAVADQHLDNVLASPHSTLASARFERFDAVFSGAGDTLSAALAALLAGGDDLQAAVREALGYLDRSLDGGFRPGMGHVLPDRLFWAQATGAEPADAESEPDAELPTAASFGLPPNETQH